MIALRITGDDGSMLEVVDPDEENVRVLGAVVGINVGDVDGPIESVDLDEDEAKALIKAIEERISKAAASRRAEVAKTSPRPWDISFPLGTTFDPTRRF